MGERRDDDAPVDETVPAERSGEDATGLTGDDADVRATEEVGADDDTDEIPVIDGPVRTQATGLWLGAGAIAGLVGLVVFTGGLGSSGDASRTDEASRTTTTPPARSTPAVPPRRTTTTSPTPPPPVPTQTSTIPSPATSGTASAPSGGTATQTTPRTTTPSPDATPDARTDATPTDGSPAAPATATPDPSGSAGTAPPTAPGAFTLTLRGKSEVFIEVKERSEKGDTVFAGRVGGKVGKKLTSRVPLWLNVSWAPNAIIQIDGRTIPVDGGTEYYLARATGLRRVTDGN